MNVTFIDHYLMNGFKVKEAAISAGYSETNAASVGNRLLERPSIKKAIEARLATRKEENAVTAKKVIDEFAKIAFVKITDIFQNDGSVKPLDEIPEAALAALVGVERRVSRHSETINYLLADKQAALNSLGRHFGLFTDNLNISGKIDVTKMDDGELDALIGKYLAKTSISNAGDGEGTASEGKED
jgi:phage terminase small subunit